MLKFTFDITTRIATPSHVQSIRRGDDEEIEVTLQDDGEAYELQAGEKLIFALKAKSAKRNTDPLIHVLTEDWTNAANVYTAPLDTENVDLLTAIDGLEAEATELQLVGDIAWYADSAEGTKPKSSQDLDVTCKNDVSRDGDGIPPASTTFWQRVKAVFSGAWFAKDDGTQLIAPIIASQAEAEAGTLSTKLMTPQRTAQAIAALAPTGGGGGVTDHGALAGLADDDHVQYHNDARGDARYAALSHTQAISTITGLQTALDGKAATSHAHTQSSITGLVTALAAKANLSGGKLATGEVPTACAVYLGLFANFPAIVGSARGTVGDFATTSTGLYFIITNDGSVGEDWLPMASADVVDDLSNRVAALEALLGNITGLRVQSSNLAVTSGGVETYVPMNDTII